MGKRIKKQGRNTASSSFPLPVALSESERPLKCEYFDITSNKAGNRTLAVQTWDI